MIEANESLTGSVSGTQSLNASVDLGVYTHVIEETDPTVPEHVKAITEEDIAKWNQGGADLSDYATKEYVDKAIANNIATTLEGEY